ncbi:MAG: hypothetical protein GY906_37640 [bacterium]|nr:hypothetical protein [bacterium]
MRRSVLRTTVLTIAFFLLCGGKSTYCQQSRDGIEPNTIRLGHDYQDFSIEANPEACLQACIEDARCKAFTYVRPERPGHWAHCWLKEDVSPATADPCCDSGEVSRVRRGGAEGMGQVERGWCCAKNEVFQSIETLCFELGGRFFASQEAAHQTCAKEGNRSGTGSNEVDLRVGFCCAHNQVFEAVAPDCAEVGGTLYAEAAGAEASCSGGDTRSTKDVLLEGQRHAAKEHEPKQQARNTAVEMGDIPESWLLSRALPAAPTNRWIQTRAPIGHIENGAGTTESKESASRSGTLVFDVEVHPNSPNTVYAAARSGLFRSENGGQSWKRLNLAPTSLRESLAVSLHPNQPDLVLASQELKGLVYRSTNGGRSWQEALYVPPSPGRETEHGMKRIVFAPSAAHVVYAASSRSTSSTSAKGRAHGVFRSDNFGVTGSWLNASGDELLGKSISDLAVHPRNHFVAWAATVSDGLWRTENGGASWQHMKALEPEGIRAVALSPLDSDEVYAGADSGGVYRGIRQSGTTEWQWTSMPGGLNSDEQIMSIVIDPVAPNRVWIGCTRSGVHFWAPLEQRWVAFNDGLDHLKVMNLSLSSDGSTIYAATWGGGVYRLRLSK